MTPPPNSSPGSEEDEDDSALLDALEASLDSDPSLGAYRAQRREQLHAEVARDKQLREQSHGTYGEMKEEKDLMDVVTETKWCVVHFFKPGFGRCAVMDGHLKVRFKGGGFSFSKIGFFFCFFFDSFFRVVLQREQIDMGVLGGEGKGREAKMFSTFCKQSKHKEKEERNSN